MSDILLTDLTTKELNGSGVFDELMSTIEVRLDEQWSGSKLRGTEYAKVYLGSMDAAMQQSIAFLLQKQQAAAQADLTTEQINTAIAETANVEANTVLINKQVEKLCADIALVEQNTINAGIQKLILDQTVIKTISETALLDQNVLNAEVQGDNLVLEGTRIIADTHGIDAATVKTNSEVELIDQNTTNAGITATNLVRQQEKMEAETALLGQKKLSEEAQTKDMVDNAAVVGVIGKQKALYQAQTDGFSRDAEQKLAKILADSWSVRRSTDEGENPAGTGLTNVDIKQVIDKAKSGINV